VTVKVIQLFNRSICYTVKASNNNLSVKLEDKTVTKFDTIFDKFFCHCHSCCDTLRFSIVGAYLLARQRSRGNPETRRIPQYRFNKAKQHKNFPCSRCGQILNENGYAAFERPWCLYKTPRYEQRSTREWGGVNESEVQNGGKLFKDWKGIENTQEEELKKHPRSTHGYPAPLGVADPYICGQVRRLWPSAPQCRTSKGTPIALFETTSGRESLCHSWLFQKRPANLQWNEPKWNAGRYFAQTSLQKMKY